MTLPGTLFLVRHGTTAYNAVDRLQGRIDLPLNDTGKREAKALGARLRDEAIDMVVCSPMARARETAECVAAGRRIPLRIDEALAEVNIGDWEGREYAAVRRDDADFYARWLEDPGVRIPGGESFRDVCERVRPAVTALLAAPAQRILVSGHATVNRAILGVLMGLEPAAARRFRVFNASLSRLRLEEHPGGPAVMVEFWNCTEHLEEKA